MLANARDLLLAYLHDPPDKALAISGHESRARRYIQAALGDAVSAGEIKDRSDPLAAIAERLPAPRWETLLVSPRASCLRVHHPLSGNHRELYCAACDEDAVAREIDYLTRDVDDTFSRYLLLWRALPERLVAAAGDYFLRIPADTRIPDHTIWHHLDTTAGLKGAEADCGAGAAFLSFSLGPVQSFIASAKTVRDLWSASMILSWITFQAMLVIVRELGPTAFVYPALRGFPWLDRWLKDSIKPAADGKLAEPDAASCLSPCLPNRFLAVVPWGIEGETARKLAENCRNAAAQAWHEVAEAVRNSLRPVLAPICESWDERWEDQIESFFEIRTAVLPWREVARDELVGALIAGTGGFQAAFPDAHAVRQLADAIPENERPPYQQKSAGSWQAKVELSARLMQSLRSVRHIPPATARHSPEEQVPPKCTLLGSHEQMGPANLQASGRFWEEATQALNNRNLHGVRLRERERLCAIALVKRFSGPCDFRQQLQLQADDLRYDDTATIAASEWLAAAGLDPAEIRRRHGSWSGQWLHWPRRDRDADDPCPEALWGRITEARRAWGWPPAYYAVLAMDGDDMGGWLRGDQSPKVRQVMHPDLVRYFENLRGAEAGLDARRPVGPALHAAISEALANFALHFVPPIVDQHCGTLIYAGGDDLLALLPTSAAVRCARELYQTFRSDWLVDQAGHERLLMGNKATASAGLAIVHYKEDLRLALQTARAAEKAAKKTGRDALEITACRRSGERSSALCPWDFTPHVERWLQAFRPGPGNEPGASDRWAYHLSAELPTLRGLPVDAMRAEIRRQVGRSESTTQRRLAPDPKVAAGDVLVSQFDDYHRRMQERKRRLQEAGLSEEAEKRRLEDAGVLEQFVTLCKTASFLARGRDE